MKILRIKLFRILNSYLKLIPILMISRKTKSKKFSNKSNFFKFNSYFDKGKKGKFKQNLKA